MSEISQEMVKKIAGLAKISFNDEDLPKISRQLTDIVSYVEKLKELDTSEVVPLSNPFDIDKPNREDIPKDGLTVNELLANAPEAKMDYFVIPKVI